MVTHSQEVAAGADRQVVLRDGQVDENDGIRIADQAIRHAFAGRV